MRKILGEMSFSDRFLIAINNIYSEQSATIRINNELMEAFFVQRGTRQRCPLSLLLLILILEILFKNIQRDDDISGIKMKSDHFK